MVKISLVVKISDVSWGDRDRARRRERDEGLPQGFWPEQFGRMKWLIGM